MIYGELGEYPLILYSQTRMVMFWASVCHDTEKPKISNLMYKLLYRLNEENVYESPWLNCVKTILKDRGFPILLAASLDTARPSGQAMLN